MSAASVLVVDDEPGIRSTINEILSDEGYAVQTAGDASEASALYSNKAPDLVLLDIWMPDIDGITLLKRWSGEGALKCPVVIMSGHGTVDTAVEATRLGAFDYIEKPLSLSQLLRTVESALRQKSVKAIVHSPTIADRAATEPPQGKSPIIEAAREQARGIGLHNAPALITGESGSGRNLFARYIHDSGVRSGGPFVSVSCAMLADESVLEQFIGAESQHNDEPGLLQRASGGTLFLNELHELGPKAQSLLLGFLEQGSYMSPGKSEREAIDVRFIASVQQYASESLRADLLAAAGVMQLSVPTLREYPEDVPGLLKFYVDMFVDQEQLQYRHFSIAAQNRLRNYPWPGNIRELKNMVRRLLLAGGSEEIGLGELEASLMAPTGSGQPLVKKDLLALPMREAREEFERAYLTQQLELCEGKVGKLAERVGMERTHLYRKLRSLGVDFR